jgi:predicted enzyme related to lactoylglutathione lyase
MSNLIAWVEIPTQDFQRAVKFYNSVLQFEMEGMDFGHEKMAIFPNGEGAIIEAEGYQPASTGVLVSLNVTDTMEASLDRVKAAGGEVLKEKTKIEAEGRGYFAIFKDSEGNRLGFYSDK